MGVRNRQDKAGRGQGSSKATAKLNTSAEASKTLDLTFEEDAQKLGFEADLRETQQPKPATTNFATSASPLFAPASRQLPPGLIVRGTFVDGQRRFDDGSVRAQSAPPPMTLDGASVPSPLRVPIRDERG